MEIFVTVSQLFDPLEDGKDSNLWITRSYDPSSHFEVASEDILNIYERIMGEKLDMNIEPDDDEDY
jgi:Rab GDP dissociation inhibitor